MINRKEFLKSCTALLCGSGVCCAMKASAQTTKDPPRDCNAKEFSEVRDRADAARLRFSKLIEIIEAR